MIRPSRVFVYAAFLFSASMWLPSKPASAQGAQSGLVTFYGAVVDSLRRPIEDADVFIQQLQRRIRTGADGKFVLEVKPGKYTVTIRRIGYIADSRKVTVGDQGLDVQFSMRRAAFSLPSVITTAERGGLSGVIADTGYRPMPGVKVHVISTSHQVETDSTGAFFAPVPPGHYLVDITRNGYDRQLISVTIPANAGRQVAAWMVPQTQKPNPRVGANLYDMRVRQMRAGPVSGQHFTREDIERAGWTELREVASVAAGRLMNPNCPALINGGPQWRELWEITTREVEYIETYTHRAPVPTVNAPRQGDISVKPSTSVLPSSVCGTTLIVWLRH